MPILFDTAQERDSIYSLLVEKNIKPRKYFYPLTVNFDYFKEKTDYSVEKCGLGTAAAVADRILCLPLYPSLEISTVDYIANLIEENHKKSF
jgi:dTDP-4-amino-4,6-dideoxygalactose transaminase